MKLVGSVRWDDKERDVVWCVREECGRGSVDMLFPYIAIVQLQHA